MRISKLGALLTLLIGLTVIGPESAAAVWGSKVRGASKGREAYVTLLYGDEFLLGVRVLGKSIRDTGSKKDMVVLVSDGVSDYAKNLLKADGWIIDMISLLANPNQVRPARFWGVYTKLKIFNMTEYKKVVYLDADTIVVKNIEDLFKCGKFCANLKHSERLNSGVMVVEPSEVVFNDMMSKVTTLPSYTGGDQGFLNSYYSDFPNARVFQPSIPWALLKSRPTPPMERLSTLYNADVGLYMLANKWMVNENELCVIHYTLGPLKPWDWWTSWLVKPVEVWQHIREQLEDSLPGTGGGKNPEDELLVKFLFLLPLCALLLFYYQYNPQARAQCRSSLCDNVRNLFHKILSGAGVAYTGISSSPAISSPRNFYNGALSKVPASLGVVSIVICLLAALVALAISFTIVPRQVMPWAGLLLMYEWTFTVFSLLFGGFLQFTYLWGKTTANQGGSFSFHLDSSDYESAKGHQKQGLNFDFTTWHYWFSMAALYVAAPSIPFIFGITALFLRLGLMVAGVLVFVSFMTYASEHLAIIYFLKGLEDRDSIRTRSNCFLC